MKTIVNAFREDFALHPWLWRCAALSFCAALGEALGTLAS